MAAVIETAARPAAAATQRPAGMDRSAANQRPAAILRPAMTERPRTRPSHIGMWLSLAAVIAGYLIPTEVYLTPQNGLGYTLGIIGGSMMLVVLIYPLRKRKPSLAFLGSVKFWFRIHMVFGIVGPLAVLYHANFSLGATNSNVALVCMLLVSGSGLIGRYLYTRIHFGLYGRRATLKELTDDADDLRQHSGALKLLPGLVKEVERAEQHIGAPSKLVVRPVLAALRQRSETRRICRLVRYAIEMVATRSPVLREQGGRFTIAATGYVAARLLAARRVAEFEASERLFAAWHIFHMPLFFMLIIVGVVHVIAVHVY